MKSQAERERVQAAVRHYEYDTMVSELSYLEKLAAPRGADESEQLRSLENRPFAARLLETRSAGVLLGWVQRFGEKMTGRADPGAERSRNGTAPGRRELIAANRIPLNQVPHDPSILERRPKVLLDLTPVSRGPGREPADHAARAMAEAAVRTGVALPVLTVGATMCSYYAHPALTEAIVPGDGDVLVVAGAFWPYAREYPTIMRAAAAAGARIALLIHDVFPLRFPAMYPSEVVDAFETALMAMLPLANVCVINASSTADDLRSYLQSVGRPMRWLRFERFKLGLATDSPSGAVRASVVSALDGNATYVSVGALEPRNGHAIALDACDLAWANGRDFSYAIVGPYRWRTQALRQRILDHPELNRRLFWITDPTGSELAYAYARCRAAIVASVAEADDLPILAPARHGAPVIASDLPALREVGYADVRWFPAGSAPSLVTLIETTQRAGHSATSTAGRTWDDCIRQLVERLSTP